MNILYRKIHSLKKRKAEAAFKIVDAWLKNNTHFKYRDYIELSLLVSVIGARFKIAKKELKFITALYGKHEEVRSRIITASGETTHEGWGWKIPFNKYYITKEFNYFSHWQEILIIK